MKHDKRPWIAELVRKGAAAKITRDEVKARFDQLDSSSYGLTITKWCPDFEHVHGLLIELLRPYAQGKARLLDLGGGTGRVARLLLEAYPDSHVVVQDISANMLSEVPRTLEPFTGRFECAEGDFFDEGLDFEPGSFQAIVSVHAIHHGRGVDAYRGLYQRIRRWLAPGGAFVCMDNVAGGAPELIALDYATWAKALEDELTPEHVDRFVDATIREDTPLALPEHLKLLEDCGFRDAAVVWKKHIFGIYLACSPEQPIR